MFASGQLGWWREGHKTLNMVGCQDVVFFGFPSFSGHCCAILSWGTKRGIIVADSNIIVKASNTL